MKEKNEQVIEDQAEQRWEAYSQEVFGRSSHQKKQHLQEFWASYDQLLAQARQQQQKQVKAVTQAMPHTQTTIVATTSEYAYLPWVKLMVPYWGELPLTVSYEQAQKPSIKYSLLLGLSSILIIVFGLIALITLIMLLTIGIHWQLLAVELVSGLVLVGLFNVKLPEVPTDKHIFQFQADFLLYEKRTVYTRKNKPHKSSFTKILYDSIGYIYTEERGVSIHPASKDKWVDDGHKTCRSLMFDKNLVAFNQISSFIRDVINANYNTP